MQVDFLDMMSCSSCFKSLNQRFSFFNCGHAFCLDSDVCAEGYVSPPYSICPICKNSTRCWRVPNRSEIPAELLRLFDGQNFFFTELSGLNALIVPFVPN